MAVKGNAFALTGSVNSGKHVSPFSFYHLEFCFNSFGKQLSGDILPNFFFLAFQLNMAGDLNCLLQKISQLLLVNLFH